LHFFFNAEVSGAIFDLAIMKRRRKLIDRRKDDLPPAFARTWAAVVRHPRDGSRARIEAGGPVTQPDAVTSGCDALTRI
jgi:ABC-type phosphonate transport system ATPase subunit